MLHSSASLQVARPEGTSPCEALARRFRSRSLPASLQAIRFVGARCLITTSALRQRLFDHSCHAREGIAVLSEPASMHVGEAARFVDDEKCRYQVDARGTLP